MSNYKNKLQEYCQKNKLALPKYTHHKSKEHDPLWGADLEFKGKIYYSKVVYTNKKDAEQDVARQVYDSITGSCPSSRLENLRKMQKASTYVQPKTSGDWGTDFTYDDAQRTFQRVFLNNLERKNNNYTLEQNMSRFDSNSSTLLSTTMPTMPTMPTIDTLLNSSTNLITEILADTKIPSPINYHVFIDLENIQPNIPMGAFKYSVEIQFFISTFTTVRSKKYEKFGKVNIIDTGLSDAADYLLTFSAGEIANTKSPDDTGFIIVSRDKKLENLTFILKTKGFNVNHYKDAESFEAFLNSLLQP